MGIGKISGHRAESPYSGSGICYVRTSFIASSASRSAQASAISRRSNSLKRGILRDIEVTAYCLPDFQEAEHIAQMNGIWNARSEVCSQAMLSSPEVACGRAAPP